MCILENMNLSVLYEQMFIYLSIVNGKHIIFIKFQQTHYMYILL